MKWSKILPYLIIAEALLSSCSSDDDPTVAVPIALASVQVKGNGIQSRDAYYDGGTITEGSIGIYTYGTSYSYNNVKYNYGSTFWTPDSKAIYLTGSNTTLVAYTPYSSTFNITSVPMKAGEYSEYEDICTGRVTGINNQSSSFGFTLSHVYSRLTLTICTNLDGDASISNIAISGPGIYSSATANLSGTSPVIINKTANTINFDPDIPSLAADYPVAVDFFMIPAAASAFTGPTTIAFTVNGTVQSITLPVSAPADGGLNTLAGGTDYTVSVFIKPTSVTLNSVTINPWTVGSASTLYPVTKTYL